jgi:ribose transport system permease protein
MSEAGTQAGKMRRRASQLNFTRILTDYGLVLVLLVMVAVFSALKPETYFTTDNFISVAESQAITGLMALAIICVLVVGEFDLSFTAIFGLAQVLVIGLITRDDVSWVIAVLAVVGIGLIVGLINALLTARLQVNSFIGTLGVATVIGGISVGYTDGQVVTGVLPQAFTDLARNELFGIALPVFYVLAAAVVLYLVLGYSASGRHMVATGGNPAAARLAGIKTGRSIMLAFLIAGVLSALAAVISGSQLGSGQPLLANSYLLPAYAAVFLGATAITPGRFNVWGTVIGVYLLGLGTSGLQQVGLEPWIQDAFNGLMLLAAVTISGFFTRRVPRAARSEVAETADAR